MQRNAACLLLCSPSTAVRVEAGAGGHVKVIGKDIGPELDSMLQLIAGRVGTSDRELRIVPWEGDGLSDVKWTPKSVTISLHSGVPTHALPHVLGVALQHVRQSLDGYPIVLKPKGAQPEGSDLIRASLRELVFEPDAEAQLISLNLDREWENEQRHQGMKALLKEPPEDWNSEESLGGVFIALQYARLSLNHPPQMWLALQKRAMEVVPEAASLGERALLALKKRRWGTAAAALDSLCYVRDELGIQDLVRIEDGNGTEF